MYAMLLVMMVAWIIFSIVVVVNTWPILSACIVGYAGLGTMLLAPLMVPLNLIAIHLIWGETVRARSEHSCDPHQALCQVPMMLNVITIILVAPYFAFMGFRAKNMRACAPTVSLSSLPLPPLPSHARIVMHAQVWVSLVTITFYIVWWKRARACQRRQHQHMGSHARPLLVLASED